MLGVGVADATAIINCYFSLVWSPLPSVYTPTRSRSAPDIGDKTAYVLRSPILFTPHGRKSERGTHVPDGIRERTEHRNDDTAR